MQYITGIYAMNLQCSLDTCGDWHKSALNWDNIKFGDTEESIFGEYGLETHTDVPEHAGEFLVANHVRAGLDMIDSLDFAHAQGLREEFICDEKYTKEILEGVAKIWDYSDEEKRLKIDSFMLREYRLDWFNFKRCLK